VDLVAEEFRNHSPVTREIGQRINPISEWVFTSVINLKKSSKYLLIVG
jgi:hypothetical protein